MIFIIGGSDQGKPVSAEPLAQRLAAVFRSVRKKEKYDETI